jgi:hypothetical protein
MQDHQFLVSLPPLPEEGPLVADLASTVSEAPEAEESQDEAEESEEDTSSTTSPPPALSEDAGIDKKRKRVDELASSSTSAQRTVADEALFSKRVSSSLTSWHRKFFLSSAIVSYSPSLFRVVHNLFLLVVMTRSRQKLLRLFLRLLL